MSKFFYNRTTTRICAKKPFIVTECSCDCFGFGKFPINNCVLYSPGWTNLKKIMKVEILPLHVINDQLVTFFVPSECLSAKICCSWSSDKFAKRATYEFFWLYFCCLLDQDLRFQREGKLHCSLIGRKLLSQVKKKKKCSRHLIYTQACVNKDFVHSGSIGLI